MIAWGARQGDHCCCLPALSVSAPPRPPGPAAITAILAWS